MKITDPQVIKTGENDLIASVQKNLDQDIIKKIIADRMAGTNLVAKGGQIVVHDNQVAFRMDFDLQVSGSLLFDRQGNYIPDGPEPKPAQNDSEADLEALEGNDLDAAQPDAAEDLALTDLDRDTQNDSETASLTEQDPHLPNAPIETPDDNDLDTADLETSDLETSDLETSDLETSDLETSDLDTADLADEDLSNEELTGENVTGTALDDDDLEFGSLDLEENNDTDQDDMLDEDINDILQESREFWEQKKDL
ncbi:MAG: hypothetical protein ABR534_08050 [Desulfotignum sp.]|nr:hypothetical protein [Desulfobacteraceae bacterium]